jgi:hypothetical protein
MTVQVRDLDIEIAADQPLASLIVAVKHSSHVIDISQDNSMERDYIDLLSTLLNQDVALSYVSQSVNRSLQYELPTSSPTLLMFHSSTSDCGNCSSSSNHDLNPTITRPCMLSTDSGSLEMNTNCKPQFISSQYIFPQNPSRPAAKHSSSLGNVEVEWLQAYIAQANPNKPLLHIRVIWLSRHGANKWHPRFSSGRPNDDRKTRLTPTDSEGHTLYLSLHEQCCRYIHDAVDVFCTKSSYAVVVIFNVHFSPWTHERENFQREWVARDNMPDWNCNFALTLQSRIKLSNARVVLELCTNDVRLTVERKNLST